VFSWYIKRFMMSEWQNLGRELVVQNMRDAFILIDARGCFLDANEMAYTYFPALRKFLVGTSLSYLKGFSTKLLSLDNGSGSMMLDINGEEKFLRVSQSPLKVREKTIGFSIMIYDDTERERMMIALDKERKKAEQAAGAKSTFLATMSHEMRTPMNAIIGMSELALRESLSPQVQGYVSSISQAGSNLLSLINDVLDFS
jgi:signal transduction histidine kinase